MREWRVLIVEDDPTVRYLHEKLIRQVPGYTVVATAENVPAALRELQRCWPDLLLLDITLGGGSGLKLLRRLRAGGRPIEVIVVSAARDSATVQALVQLGVVDYLVKPSTPERLRQALMVFRVRAHALAGGELQQDDVDASYGSDRRLSRLLPKGLGATTLTRVHAALEEAARPVSAEEIARLTSLARVTARRYVEYLVATEQATVESVMGAPGRPRKVYRLRRD